jgi:hypothetical protein
MLYMLATGMGSMAASAPAGAHAAAAAIRTTDGGRHRCGLSPVYGLWQETLLGTVGVLTSFAVNPNVTLPPGVS